MKHLTLIVVLLVSSSKVPVNAHTSRCFAKLAYLGRHLLYLRYTRSNFHVETNRPTNTRMWILTG